MKSTTGQWIAQAALLIGAGTMIATVFVATGSIPDRDLTHIGFVILVVAATACVCLRVRKLTADELERARQDGYDDGRADAFAVQPRLIDLASHRAAIAERRTAQ